MRLRPRQGLLVGIAVLAAGSVVLEIALARTSAALSGPHLALAAPTLALGGAGLGGALLAAVPGLVRRPALLARLSQLAGLAAAATLAALLVLLHVKVPDALGRAALGPAAAVYLTAALPFLFVGIAFAAAVRHVPVLAGRVVFAIFAGAALGAPLALGAMRVGAPRAGLLVILADAVASLLFYWGARGADPVVQRPRGATVATSLLAGVVLLAGDVGAPWLKLPSLRFSPLDKIEAQEWSALGLISIDKAAGGITWIHTDGTAGLPIYDGKTAIPPTPDELPYVLHRDHGPTAIVGGGGGREVRTALKYGQKEIVAVERDPILVRAFLLDRYRRASGDVYDSPTVKIAIEDGRSFLRRDARLFHNIALVLPEAQTAEAAGVTAAEPMDLYTVESFADLLSRLAPEGTLAVTRWDTELDRLIALTAEALRRTGAADPSQHLYACSANRSTTLVARRTPFAPSDLALLRNFCRRNKLNEVFASDQPHGELRRRLAADPDPAALAAAATEATDLRPPTGDRPFFAATVPAHRLLEALTEKQSGATEQALLVLAALLAVAAALVFFAVGLPFAARPRWPTARVRPLLFFTGVGAGLAFASTALVPRAVVLLGHPLYLFTTALPALLASVAVGGLGVARVRAHEAEASAGGRTELLVATLAAVAVALGPIVEVGLGLPFGMRFAGALLLLVPVGLLAGSLLALGIRIVGATSPPLTAWCWGMGAVGAFVAAVAAVPAAMMLGYGAVLLAAGVSVLLAAVCVPRPAR